MRYNPNLYDSDPRDFLKEEVVFYIELIKKYNPKNILELGVGTGRIFKELLNFVDSGVGIDNSDEMILACKEKCSDMSNYRLINDSFVTFKVDNKFDFIYLPFNTFQHILSKEEQMNLYLQKPEPGHITMTSTRLGELRLS